jgi:osmotically-inducible protein OsmY
MKVKTALVFHRNVNAHKTDVSVKDGIVTLKGEAASQAQKDLTTEFAKDVAGVKGVVNEMTVAKTPPASGATMGESIDDASITAQVKTTLLLHRSTGVLRTKVETTNGVVTVSGTARNPAEKDLVTKIVQDVYGVKSVVNNMTIAEAMNR